MRKCASIKEPALDNYLELFGLKILYTKVSICFIIQQHVDHLKLVCKEGGCTLVPVYLQGSQESLLMNVSVV